MTLARPGATTRKDADWPSNRKLHVPAACRVHMLRQAQWDARFLCGLRIVDYSLLLGIHNVVGQRLFADASRPPPHAAAALLPRGAGFGGSGRLTPVDKPGSWSQCGARGRCALLEADGEQLCGPQVRNGRM